MAWCDGLEGVAKEIAESDSRTIRVLAGPGTGKTFSLMRRVARLLEEGINAQRILLVTFTRVAAKDLETEIAALDAPNADLVRKGTLHSFCYSVLNQNNVLLLTGRTPRPLLDFEERFLLEDLGEQNTFGNLSQRRSRLKALEAAWAREQSQNPGWSQDPIDHNFEVELEDWLRFHKSILVGQLVSITLSYLRNNPGCRERSYYTYILVDEYQDLNRAEQLVIDILNGNGSLMVIGDEDQSIYEALRYAHPEGILEFSATHPGTHDCHLTECRRCPTRIVEMANELVSHNTRRYGHNLMPVSTNSEGYVEIVQWQDLEAEVSGIVDYIDNKIGMGDFDPGRTLVLSPRRQIGYMIRDELINRNRAAHSYFKEEPLDGDPKQYDSCEAQRAYTLLNLIVNPNDRVALRCWLGFGHRNLRRREYRRLRDHCREQSTNSFEAIENLLIGDISLSYTDGIRERYAELKNILDEKRLMSPVDLVDDLFPAGQDWSEPFRLVKDELDDGWTAEQYLDNLHSSIIQPEAPTEVDYVRIMSLHKSKGLTADNIIIVGAVEGLIPYRQSGLEEDELLSSLEEQRRLFYVAITRARENLVISSVLRLPRALAWDMGARLVGGNQEFGDTIASRFLSELGPTCPTPIRGEDWEY